MREPILIILFEIGFRTTFLVFQGAFPKKQGANFGAQGAFPKKSGAFSRESGAFGEPGTFCKS